MDGLVERASESVLPYAAPAVPKGTLARRRGGCKCGYANCRPVRCVDTGAATIGAATPSREEPSWLTTSTRLSPPLPHAGTQLSRGRRLSRRGLPARVGTGLPSRPARRHRGVVVLGQDPATHETIVRRILVGEAGQRIQGFPRRLGITTSYVMINTFLYSVYGQGGGEKHKDDPNIAGHRNQWLDKLIVGQSVDAVVTLGRLADQAYPGSGTQTPLEDRPRSMFQQAVTHPTFPESSSSVGSDDEGRSDGEDAPENWTWDCRRYASHITQPDAPRPPPASTGTKLAGRRPRRRSPRPTSLPASRRGALTQGLGVTRATTGSAALPTTTEEQKDEAKRATIVVSVPTQERRGTRRPDRAR